MTVFGEFFLRHNELDELVFKGEGLVFDVNGLKDTFFAGGHIEMAFEALVVDRILLPVVEVQKEFNFFGGGFIDMV